MDPVSPISATTAQTTQATSASSNSTLSMQDFLNLFTTQLEDQDPLDPMDTSQMLDQMVQLNTVQAMDDITQAMQNLEAAGNLQTAGLIGLQVQAQGNSLTIDTQGNVSAGYYQLASPGQATIQIFDANGNLVNTINEGAVDTSQQTFTWNGEDQQGNQLPAGNYTFSVSAVDGNNNPIQVTTSMLATVTGISFENGVTYLDLGSEQVPLNNVIAITQ